MATSATDDGLWEVVRSRRRGILATVGPAGYPHLTNVHYLAEPEDRTVVLTTTTNRVKGQNVLRDPHVALHVSGDDWWNFAVAEGRATAGVAERPGDGAIDQLHRIFSEFRGPQPRPAFDEQMIATGRMIVRIDVERVYGLIVPAAAGEGAA